MLQSPRSRRRAARTASALACIVSFAPCGAASNEKDVLVPAFSNHAVLRFDQDTGAFLGFFIPPMSGGLDGPHGMTLGPDGALYVGSFNNDKVLRYDGTTGAFLSEFVTQGLGGLDGPTDCVFGADGNLYVASFATGSVERYDGQGNHLGAFVAPGSIPQMFPEWLRFGPDGNLYVCTGPVRHSVMRFHGQTGTPIDEFVAPLSGGLFDPHGFTFGPDGNLYVTSFQNHTILRYDGQTGAFLDVFVAAAAGGLTSPHGVTFGPDGDLYVTSWSTHEVLRYDGGTGAFLGAFVASGAGGLLNPQTVFFRPPHVLPCDGGAGAYGQGCPGSNGQVPELCVGGCPSPGDAITYSVSGGVPSSSVLLFFGLSEASLGMGFGCTLNAAPLLPLILTLPLSPAGDVETPPLPIPASTPQVTIFVQGFGVDPANPGGFSNTRGIQLDIR